MEMIEIILLIAGGVIFILSFFIPDRKGAAGGAQLSESEVRELVGRELEALRSQVDEMVEESVEEAMEKTERSLERLSNEKIMAVNEYSDTVLKEIHKNHEEAVFLYDMLNNKHSALKNTMADVGNAVKGAEEMIRSLEQKARTHTAAEEDTADDADAWKRLAGGVHGAATEQGRKGAVRTEPEGEAVGAQPPEGQEGDSPESNNNDRILRLYKQGKSAVAIARELELGIGEVRLVIDLFRREVSADNS